MALVFHFPSQGPGHALLVMNSMNALPKLSAKFIMQACIFLHAVFSSTLHSSFLQCVTGCRQP
jgi:hypothetical protein